MKEFEFNENSINNLPNDIINYLKTIVLNENSKDLKEICKSAIINRECKNRAINFIENLTLKERYDYILEYYGDKKLKDLKETDFKIIYMLRNIKKYFKNKKFSDLCLKCLNYFVTFNNFIDNLADLKYVIKMKMYMEFFSLIDLIYLNKNQDKIKVIEDGLIKFSNNDNFNYSHIKNGLDGLIKFSNNDNFNYSNDKLFIPKKIILDCIKLVKNYNLDLVFTLEKLHYYIDNYYESFESIKDLLNYYMRYTLMTELITLKPLFLK